VVVFGNKLYRKTRIFEYFFSRRYENHRVKSIELIYLLLNVIDARFLALIFNGF